MSELHTEKVEFQANDTKGTGSMAAPEQGGPGVIVLHAWWGLNSFFKNLCERLAREGFVALAPDLYGGQSAATIQEAEQLISGLSFEETRAKATGAVQYLRELPERSRKGLGAVGFSMGGAWALLLSTLMPEDIAAVVVFYGSEGADFHTARAAYQGHFAEVDEWEPSEGVRQMEANMRAAGREVMFYTYPGAGHWFFEDNRPDAYNAEAARLAWERTIRFLRAKLE